MRLSWDQIQANAVSFSKRWKDAKDELEVYLVKDMAEAGIVARLMERYEGITS